MAVFNIDFVANLLGKIGQSVSIWPTYLQDLQSPVARFVRHALEPKLLPTFCFAPGRWAKYCDQHVCICLSVGLSICLSACPSVCALAYRKSTRPNFTQCSVQHVTFGRDSVLLWRQCNAICTSGLWMASCFHINNGANGPESKSTLMFRSVCQVALLGANLLFTIAVLIWFLSVYLSPASASLPHYQFWTTQLCWLCSKTVELSATVNSWSNIDTDTDL